MVYLLSEKRHHSSIVSVIKEDLTTWESDNCAMQWCFFLIYAGKPPLMCTKPLVVLVNKEWHPRLVLGSGTKSEVVSVFSHWSIAQLSLDSCGLPLTVLWRLLFLNKWVYDSDFLLPLLSLSLIWNSTHPSERAQSCCCRSQHFTCATWLGGSVSPPFEKPVATPIFDRAWIFVQILH